MESQPSLCSLSTLCLLSLFDSLKTVRDATTFVENIPCHTTKPGFFSARHFVETRKKTFCLIDDTTLLGL